MNSHFRHSFLKGESTKSKNIDELVNGKYDFGLFSSSWDKRCLCITNTSGLSVNYCTVVVPKLRDDLGFMDKHDPLLSEFTNSIGESHILSGDTSNPSALWDKVEERLLKVYKKIGNPLKVFIDLSASVRYLTLGVLSIGLQKGLVEQITFFYAEGEYPQEKSKQDKHELFTSGGWDVKPVPGLFGEWDPDKDRHYFVSIGFEGSKTLRLVSREEPDKVSLLFPEPGFKGEYVDRTYERNQALIDKYQIQETNILRSSAGDAIEGWKLLTESEIEDVDRSNVYYVCCGTKPHSLSLALRALISRNPALLYVSPDRHRVVDVDPNGVFWRYDLKDMSAMEKKIFV